MSEVRAGVVAHGLARCNKPERYIQQLVSHWSHKFATHYDADGRNGTIPFSDTEIAVLAAEDGGIGITLTTGDDERSRHMRGVIERHIDRFAFREAPLTYDWND